MNNCTSAFEQYARWMEQADEETVAELREIQGDSEQILSRFGTELTFGTGGLRGILGAGTNRMNFCVVRRATRGLAAYMKKSGLPLSAAISYDSRHRSEEFAMTAAETLASCGIEAWVYPRLEPTPALSWAVRALGCGAGIMITASHNPAEYNGYKVYGPDGCQITDCSAEKIFEEIRNSDYFGENIAACPDKTHIIPETVLDAFIREELNVVAGSLNDLRVVYSPLNGTGLECVSRVLHKAGVKELIVVPEQEKPDGNFPTCPLPNPEVKEAMALGLSLSEVCRPDVFLATDPDCDRVGVAVPDGKNWRLLSGNEVGVLLFDYICRRHSEQGDLPERPVAVTTIVSTEMADAIAEYWGVELLRTLTGFKYIGEQIGLLEQKGETERFLLGFEESYGYLTGPHVRDKDAVNACLVICDMVAYYKRKRQSISEILARLENQFGHYSEELLTVAFPEVEGAGQMCMIMDGLRREPPKSIAGCKVAKTVDYLQKQGDLPQANVLAFFLENTDRIIFRPSGTEPKIKAYLSVKRTSREECQRSSGDLKKAVAGILSTPEAGSISPWVEKEL